MFEKKLILKDKNKNNVTDCTQISDTTATMKMYPKYLT